MAYVTKTCEGCGVDFELQPGKNGRIYHQKRYCTRSCWLKIYNTTDREHSIRGAKCAADHWRRRRGESRGGSAYVKENQRHQHRVVAESVLGRPLTNDEVVHHEDRDRKNNERVNLIVFPSQSTHVKHHQHCMTQHLTCVCDCIRLKEVMPK